MAITDWPTRSRSESPISAGSGAFVDLQHRDVGLGIVPDGAVNFERRRRGPERSR
jgi:hypothetical protein